MEYTYGIAACNSTLIITIDFTWNFRGTVEKRIFFFITQVCKALS